MIFFWIFFQKSVLGRSDNTLSNFYGPSEHQIIGKSEGKFSLDTLFFNKLLPSIFRQVRRWDGHIGLNILYWTCTFNFRPKFERRPPSPFQQFFSPYYKIKVIFFWIFFQKSVHSILGQNLTLFFNRPQVAVSANVARSRRFFYSILYPYEFFDFWLKIKVIFFWIFFQKSVLGRSDNTLSNF